MRCFVTGATGHVGSYVVRKLLSAGCEVAALVRPTSDAWRIRDVAPRIRFIQGDLAEIRGICGAIREFAPDTVVHLGWYGVDARRRNDPAQVRQNLIGTLELVEVAREAGCSRWIGLGSQAEYGTHAGILSEETPVCPESMYGTVKLCAGLLARKLCEAYGIGFAWLRLLAAYGPHDDPHHLIPYVIGALLRREKPSLTAGSQLWDYVFVEDAAAAVYAASVHPGAEGIFTLGSGEARPLRQIVERIRDMIDPRLPLGFGEVPLGPNAIRHLQADTRRLRAATGWSPKVELEAGLRRTVDWYRSRETDAAVH
jgi:UDP-glucose 4-epimerase